jgi:23S rRNA (pseudouridine1915-N3)-methyltransferase
MDVKVLVVGRAKEPLKAAIADYESRASRYWKLEVIEVDGGAKGSKTRPEEVKQAEEERLLARIPDGAEVVALTRAGKPLDSRGLAVWLEQRGGLRGSVAFLIGGAFGLGPGVLARATRQMSLSELTLPHELARLVLAEQLYRAGTILKGEPYHKGAE